MPIFAWNFVPCLIELDGLTECSLRQQLKVVGSFINVHFKWKLKLMGRSVQFVHFVSRDKQS